MKQPHPKTTATALDAIKTDKDEHRRLVRMKQILKGDPTTSPPTPPLVPIGRSTLLDWEKQGKFPKSLKVGNCRMWRYVDVLKWLEQDGKWNEKDNRRDAA